MLPYMLDTNILIYSLKNKPEVVREKFEARDGQICASRVTAMELLYGAHNSQAVRRNLDAIEGLPGRLDLLDFDLGAAEHAGQICAERAASGTPIGSFDVMIEGHARSTGLCLATNTERAFTRVRGVRIKDWTL